MSDEALYASKGPSRGKSLGVEAIGEHGSTFATVHQLRQDAAPGLYPVRVGSNSAEGVTGPAAATSPGT